VQKKFEVAAYFRAYDKITAPLSSMANKVKLFYTTTSSGLRTVNKGLDSIIGGAKRFGYTALAAGTMFSFAARNVVMAGADFEDQLLRASMKFDKMAVKGTDAYAQLESRTREFARTTEFTGEQVARGMKLFAQSGFDAETAVKSMESAMNFATVAEVDLDEAVRMATKAIGAYGLTATDATQKSINFNRVVDMLTKTADSASMTVVDLFEAIKLGASPAVATGSSIDEINTILAVFHNSAIDATSAGTGLRRMALAMKAPTGQAADLFRRLKINIEDSQHNVKGLIPLFVELRDKLVKLRPAARIRVLDEMFGKIGITAATNLLGTTNEEIERLGKSVKDYAGYSKYLAGTFRQEMLSIQIKKLLSVFESVKLAIVAMSGQKFTDIINKTSEWTRKNEDLIATGFDKWFTKIIDNWSTIVKWGKAVFYVVGALVALSLITKALLVPITLINLLMAANPAALAVIGILALTAAFSGLYAVTNVFFEDWNRWFEKQPFWIKALTGVVTIFTTLKESIVRLSDALTDDVMKVFLFFERIFDRIGMVLSGKMTNQDFKDINDAEKLRSDFGKDRYGNDVRTRSGITATDVLMRSPQMMALDDQARADYRKSQQDKISGKATIVIEDKTGRAKVEGGSARNIAFELMSSGVF